MGSELDAKKEIDLIASVKKIFSEAKYFVSLLATIVFLVVQCCIISRAPYVYFFGDKFDAEIIETKVESGGKGGRLYKIYFIHEGRKCVSQGGKMDNYQEIKVGDVVQMRKSKSGDNVFVASCSSGFLLMLNSVCVIPLCLLFLADLKRARVYKNKT